MNFKISILLFISFFVIMSCASTFKIKDTTFSFDFKKVESFISKRVETDLGEFEIINDGRTPFYDLIDGRKCIKVRLINNDNSRDVFFLIDTGAPGSCVTSNIIKALNPKKSEHLMMLSVMNQELSSHSTYGFFFDYLEADGFNVHNILLQDLSLDSLGLYTVDGQPVEGILGISVLKQCPFYFLNSSNELVFSDEELFSKNAKKIKLKKSGLKNNRIRLSYKIKKNRIVADLDTGAVKSYIPGNQLKKYKTLVKNIIDEKTKLSYYRTCTLDCLSFYEDLFENIPIWSSKESVLDNNKTIGFYVFRNYDFYCDFKKADFKFEKNNIIFPKVHLETLIKSTGFLCGFGLDVDSLGRTFIQSVQFVNGEQVIPEISLGDWVISINDIPIKDFDWSTWNDWDSAKFEFVHDQEVYLLDIVRKRLLPEVYY